MKRLFPFFRYLLLAGALPGGSILSAQVPTLRVAFHIFQTDSGTGNFHADSVREMIFLKELEQWINTKAGKLDTLTPPVSSPYVPDAGFRIRVDTVFFHRDSHAWDCSVDIDAPYMRTRYVDQDSAMSYRQKHQTLPVFIGGNISIVGGHSRNIGGKGYIGMRGFYQQYIQNQYDVAVEESAKNLLHEIGHTVGLMHNFRGGTTGDQCDTCEDNGCPDIGTSNNIMDYWPSYGHALSECQAAIISSHLKGEKGTISDVLVNDSCYAIPESTLVISRGDTIRITGTQYLHGNLEILAGGVLDVSGYLSVPQGCRIQVRRGGQLVLSKGTVGNLCGDLWEGIFTESDDRTSTPQVRFVMGGKVENALIGLIWSDAVGIIGDRALFRNNVVGISLKGDSLVSATIQNFDFITTRRLNHHEEGFTPKAFIRATRASTMNVAHCTFTNEPGTLQFSIDSCGAGIDFNGEMIEVRGCYFYRLFTGIRTFARRDQVIHFNKFENSRCGVNILSGGYQSISENIFVLQRFNDVPTFGIVAHEPGVLQAHLNRFESEYGGGQIAGLCLVNPGTPNSTCYHNEYINLPVGNIILNQADIEKELFKWSAQPGREFSDLRLGTQFRRNVYWNTDGEILMMRNPGFGVVKGQSPEDINTSFINPADLPFGGYLWLDDAAGLTAFWPGKVPPDTIDAWHGIFEFMNRDESQSRRFSEFSIDTVKGALAKLDQMGKNPGDFFSGNLFEDLETLRGFPLAARSSVIMGYLDRFHHKEVWFIQGLTEIAATNSRIDTLLVDLRDSLAFCWYLTVPWWNTPPLHEVREVPALPGWPVGDYYRLLPDLVKGKPFPSFDIQPIPASEYIQIFPRASYIPDNFWRYEIFTSDGRLKLSGSLQGIQSLKIDTGGLSGGIYFIRIFGSRMNLGTQRFMIIPR